MQDRRFVQEEKPPDWVNTVSLIVDTLGLTTIMFLTGALLVKFFL